jgi:dihydrofolate synthase / folylpolyglutamate synthase
MLANKDAESFLARLAPVTRSLSTVPVEEHDHYSPATLADIAAALDLPARAYSDVPSAMAELSGPILIAGSLYLAGTVLALNGELPQ